MYTELSISESVIAKHHCCNCYERSATARLPPTTSPGPPHRHLTTFAQSGTITTFPNHPPVVTEFSVTTTAPEQYSPLPLSPFPPPPLRQSKPRSRASTLSRSSPIGLLGWRSLFLGKSCSMTYSRPHRRTAQSTSRSLRARLKRRKQDDLMMLLHHSPRQERVKK